MKRAIYILILMLLMPVAANSAVEGAGDKSVVVATRSMPMGHVITRSDIRLVKTDSVDRRSVTVLEDVLGRQVMRPIGRNTTVKKDYIQSASTIRKGDIILLIASKGGLKVTAKGIARSAGNIGDIVRVENLRSGEYVEAEITGPSIAKVSF